jgi:hypothetical protein
MIVQLLATCGPLLLAWGLRELQAWQAKKVQSKALDAIENAAVAAVNAGLASKDQQTAVTAAKSALLAAMPNVAQATEADVDVLLAGHVAQLATTPGGSTVRLPTPS